MYVSLLESTWGAFGGISGYNYWILTTRSWKIWQPLIPPITTVKSHRPTTHTYASTALPPGITPPKIRHHPALEGTVPHRSRRRRRGANAACPVVVRTARSRPHPRSRCSRSSVFCSGSWGVRRWSITKAIGLMICDI